MRKVKMAIWLVIIALIAILIYQNQAFFLSNTSLGLDLIFVDYKTPEIKIVFVCFAFLAAGLLLGEYFDLIHQLKNKKKIKVLNAQIGSQAGQVPVGPVGETPQTGPTADTDAKTVVISPEDSPVSEEQKQ